MEQTRSNLLKATDVFSSFNSYKNKYENITDEEFKNHLLVGKNKTRFELVYFILNTLHHIVNSGYWYCYCQNRRGKCQMCKTPKLFTKIMEDIDNNMFDQEFLLFHYTKLTKKLLKLIDHDKKECINSFLNEYVLGGRDCNTATSWSVPLSESIQYTEKIQIEQLKREKLPLPPDYRDPTYDPAC